MKPKEQLRREAQDRESVRAAKDFREQIWTLDQRLGPSAGAKKERARLWRELEEVSA